MSLIPGKRRLRSLAIIAATNAIVIYTTLYSGWTLLEATLAYAGELAVLALVVVARIVVARRLPAGMGGRQKTGWPLFAGKLAAIGVSLPLYMLIVGLIVFLLLGVKGWNDPVLPDRTLNALAICWAAFLVSHVLAFISLARAGAYDELVSDGRVMVFAWRYPAMFLAALAVNGEFQFGAAIAPWFFIGSLALMAVVDTVAYVVEMDAVNKVRNVPAEAA